MNRMTELIMLTRMTHGLETDDEIGLPVIIIEHLLIIKDGPSSVEEDERREFGKRFPKRTRSVCLKKGGRSSVAFMRRR